MKKIIFLEGLPGVGKTTIANNIKQLVNVNIHVVDEIIKKNIINTISDEETDYMKNDEMKIKTEFDGIIVIDRGPISTLSYNQARSIINSKFDAQPVIKWFNKIKKIYNQKDVSILYLTTNKKSYKLSKSYNLSYDNNLDPFGSYDNQDLVEAISIFNCKKYCKNTIIKEYHKENMEDIINEIIN